MFVLRVEQFVFGQKLELFERRQAGLKNDIGFEIEDALELLQLHVEQQADARRQRIQEPDVRDRRGELDMAHALAAYFRDRDFDTAFLADDALVFHALILSAQAFILLYRSTEERRVGKECVRTGRY